MNYDKGPPKFDLIEMEKVKQNLLISATFIVAATY